MPTVQAILGNIRWPRELNIVQHKKTPAKTQAGFKLGNIFISSITGLAAKSHNTKEAEAMTWSFDTHLSLNE